MTSRTVLTIIAAPALALLVSSMAAAQTYPVRLARPAKKGDRYRISSSGSSSKRTIATADGNVVHDDTEEFTVEFGADDTVLEVRSDGAVSKEALTINNCLVKRKGSAKQLFPRGTVVVAAVEDGRKVYRISGRPVDKDAEEVLGMVSTIGSSKTSDDDVFGTRDEKKVGDSWSINSASAVKWLREDKMLPSQEDTKSSVSIEKRVTIGKEDCLVINASMDIGLITGDMDVVKVDSGEMHARMSGAFPIDTSHHAVEESHQMSMRVSGKVKPDPGGPEIRIEVKAEMKMTAHYSVL